jgi:ribosomal protein L7/L12
MNKYVLLVIVALLAIAVMRRRGESESSLDMDSAPRSDADIDQLIREGRKIEAIKAYRLLHGCDLKDAKDAVDAREKTLRPGG